MEVRAITVSSGVSDNVPKQKIGISPWRSRPSLKRLITPLFPSFQKKEANKKSPLAFYCKTQGSLPVLTETILRPENSCCPYSQREAFTSRWRSPCLPIQNASRGHWTTFSCVYTRFPAHPQYHREGFTLTRGEAVKALSGSRLGALSLLPLRLLNHEESILFYFSFWLNLLKPLHFYLPPSSPQIPASACCQGLIKFPTQEERKDLKSVIQRENYKGTWRPGSRRTATNQTWLMKIIPPRFKT